MAAGPLPGASLWDPQGSPGPQAGDQLTLERSAPLDVERLVDRLVRDPHRFIIGEVRLEPVRDLLRTPRLGPAAVLPSRLVASLPRRHTRPCRRPPVRPLDLPGQPRLHIGAQPLVGHQLGRLRSPCRQLRLPVRDRRSILLLPATGGRAGPQFPADGRRRPAQPTRDLANPRASGLEQRDVLTFRERQVPVGGRTELDQGHAATVTKPPRSDRARHASRDGRILAGRPLGDLSPERPFHIPADRRPSRRTHRRTSCDRCDPTRRSSHATPPRSRCCDDWLNPPWLPLSL